MPTVTAKKADRIPLGSAKLYVVEKTDTDKLTSNMEISDALSFAKTHAVEKNILGRIKNGATANYSSTYYTEKDDFNEVSKTIITDETFSISAGSITFDHDMVNKIVATGQYSNDTLGNEMTKIGGIKNDNGKSYVIILVHEDRVDGNIYIMIHGKNTAAIAWAFTKSAGTMTNPTFTAEPFDTEGVTAILLTTPPESASANAGESSTSE